MLTHPPVLQALDELISTVDPVVAVVLGAVRQEFESYLATARARAGAAPAAVDPTDPDSVHHSTAHVIALRKRATVLQAQVARAEAANRVERNKMTAMFAQIAGENEVDAEAAEIAKLRELGLPVVTVERSALEALQVEIVRLNRDIELIKRSRDSPAAVPVQVTSNLIEQIDATTNAIRLHRMQIACAELRMARAGRHTPDRRPSAVQRGPPTGSRAS